MRSAYTVGTRIAMLYEGRVRQVGTVDEVRHTSDPIVRQFIEGRPNLESDEGPDHDTTERFRVQAAKDAERRTGADRRA